MQPIGSSPRMRGTLELNAPVAVNVRFIPAHAGNSTNGFPVAAARSVHPRACGELTAAAQTVASLNGSSPRMRGTPSPSLAKKSASRFIPAHAGNSSVVSTAAARTTVHPRACGELASTILNSVSPTGSSPRMRGTPRRERLHAARLRFIPAHAGNSQLVGDGEHKGLGSSPRMRGTLPATKPGLALCRFIPAHAGNSAGH